MKPEAYNKTFKFEESYWWFKGRRKIVFDSVKRLTSNIKGKVLLDNGCGTGITLKEIEDFDLKLGIDHSAEALDYSKRRNCRNLICGEVYQLPLKDSSVNCILLLDVLEHLNKEKTTLSEIFRVSNKGGVVVVTVPAYQFLWSGEDETSLHKRRYVKTRLIKLMESAGFRIEKISYFNSFLMPLIYTMILFNKVFNKKAMQKSDLKKIPNVLNFILEKILYFESLLLKIIDFPFGMSLICISKNV